MLEVGKKAPNFTLLMLCLFFVFTTSFLFLNSPQNSTIKEVTSPLEVSETVGLIVNNGGEVIQVGETLFYRDGNQLYSDGKALYVTKYGKGGTEYIYCDKLDGSGFQQLREGSLKGVDESGTKLYYLTRKGDSTQFYPMCRKTPCFSYGDIRHVHRIYTSN